MKQVQGVESPGMPIPLLGHSHHFIGLEPKDILQKFLYFFEKSESKKKVCLQIFIDK